MEWFRANLEVVQKQALQVSAQATEQVKAMAAQATVQVKAVTQQASEQAQVLVANATEEAQQRLAKAREIAAAGLPAAFQQVAQSFSEPKPASSNNSAEEQAKYGVLKELVEYVGSLTYSTFSDYPLDCLPATNPLGVTTVDPGPSFRLTHWQEKHAMHVLAAVPQVTHLRFVLIPRHMSESQFWIIYFTLTKGLLPPQAFAQDTDEAISSTSAGTTAQVEGTRGVAPSSPAGHPSISATSSAAYTTPRSHSGSAKVQNAHPSSISASMAAAGTVGAMLAALDIGSGIHSGGSGGGLDAGGAGTGAAPSELAPGIVSPSTPANLSPKTSEGELIEVASGSLNAEELDNLAELENDPELAAYLQEALDMDDGGDGSGMGSAVDDLDLDDYLEQLEREEENGQGEGEDGSAKSPGMA